MKKLDFIDRYGEEAWERKKNLDREWRRNNPEYNISYYDSNKEKWKQYLDTQKDYRKDYYKEKLKTDCIYRSKLLIESYNRRDEKKGFDVDKNIDVDWFLNNVVEGKCVYCGESDWTKLGADRIDNAKPHTPNNCVCCCSKCNAQKGTKYSFEEFIELKKQNSR